jgi:hypothetical protein
MTTTNSKLVPVDHPPATLRERLRGVVAHHTEEVLAEVAPTLRRLRTLLLVLAISIPAFFVGLLVVIWRLAR